MTPEERAAIRWVSVGMDTDPILFRENQLGIARIACATTIREEVEPLEAEVAKLRALVQVLVDGMAGHARSCVGTCSCGFYGRIASALIAAKEQGFVPTNTQDNGR